ncbi:hypothetical protein [Paenibacillus polymyxa]|uniref:hypothetical protein n=1 Tax=Paenibacillus polymyxa TaxID=1406 RepID=UPI0020361900|nr:hypothetical protein [Paenibacillus polymyxa]
MGVVSILTHSFTDGYNREFGRVFGGGLERYILDLCSVIRGLGHIPVVHQLSYFTPAPPTRTFEQEQEDEWLVAWKNDLVSHEENVGAVISGMQAVEGKDGTSGAGANSGKANGDGGADGGGDTDNDQEREWKGTVDFHLDSSEIEKAGGARCWNLF